MRNFLTLFDTVKTGMTGTNVKQELSLEKLIYCKPFVLPNKKEPWVDGATLITINEPDFDLPFKLISIEAASDDLFYIATITKDEEVKMFFNVKCLVVEELAPKKYAYYLLTDMHYISEKNMINTKNLTVITAQQLDGLANSLSVNAVTSCNKLVEDFLSLLRTGTAGHVATNERVKYNINGTKKTHNFSSVVYLKPKANKSDEPILVMGRIVEWSHRFFVRGHWRRTEGKVGKDREGNYNVEDYTWVSEHVKGPEDAPIVMKHRVVTERIGVE